MLGAWLCCVTLETGASNVQPLHEKPGPKTTEGRARIAAAARESARLRWVALKSSGERTRLGPLSDEGLAALRAARIGKRAQPRDQGEDQQGEEEVRAGQALSAGE